MKNQDIRKKAAENGIYLWQVAEELGIRDDAFSRKLRKELPAEEKARIRTIIKQLKAEAAQAEAQ